MLVGADWVMMFWAQSRVIDMHDRTDFEFIIMHTFRSAVLYF